MSVVLGVVSCLSATVMVICSVFLVIGTGRSSFRRVVCGRVCVECFLLVLEVWFGVWVVGCCCWFCL